LRHLIGCTPELQPFASRGCGNQLLTFRDTPAQYDAWNIDPGTLDHLVPLGNADAVELIDKGPLRALIRLTHAWQNSKFVQDITPDAGASATYEIPCGTIAVPIPYEIPALRLDFAGKHE
jgi:alpha-mannosidase